MTLSMKPEPSRRAAIPERHGPADPRLAAGDSKARERPKGDDVWRDFIRMLRASASSRP
jgi:hypothetical protein